MSKQVIFKDDARKKIKVGVDIACNAIKTTIGPKGRNAFIDNEYQPKITNDGVTIANAITLEDKFENMGAWLVKNTSSQTNDDAGDGTSTTAVLLQAMTDEALKRPENAMDIKQSLSIAGEKVTKWIQEASRPVEDSQIKHVATVSSESEMIGNLIAEIIEKVGKTVPITIEDNKEPEVAYEKVDGLEADVGYANPVFVTNLEEGVAELEDAHVFATDRRISSLPEIKALLELLEANKDNINGVVFLVSDIDATVLGAIVRAKAMGQINAIVIKAQNYELEDMASVAGATLISDQNGIKFKDIKLEHLGKAKKVMAWERKTLILGYPNKIREDAVIALRAKEEKEKNIYMKQHLAIRANKVEGGVAIIKVGAHTDSERTYLKLKIEDAVNATKSAIDEGLVEGGGMLLYRISNKFKGNSIGEQILRNALKAPLRAIIENAGEDYTAIVKKLTKKKGYDAGNNKIVDMFKNGIVDPAKVTRCAFQNALSTASIFITEEVAIADNIKKNETTK